MKLSEVKEARTDTVFSVEFTYHARNGDGTDHEQKGVIEYGPITTEIAELDSVAEQLSRVIKKWPFEEPPTLKVLRKLPTPFLRKISEAIQADFFRER